MAQHVLLAVVAPVEHVLAIMLHPRRQSETRSEAEVERRRGNFQRSGFSIKSKDLVALLAVIRRNVAGP